MQIPILNGVYTNRVSDVRTSYPINLVPVPGKSGISNGYLRPADGIVSSGTGSGECRGGINWDGICYRVMGTKLVQILEDESLVELGTIPGTKQVTFDYSFDVLSIAADGGLYYWDGILLQRVTDADLGFVVDQLWVDGYFMTTDGEFLITTEFSNPLVVNPVKYASSEADPDPIVAIVKVKNEPYALNRYTIEVFDNVGGTGFPFARIESAQIQKGAIGTHACCVFMENLVFLGSGRNESPGIYFGANGETLKISDREIDQILQEYTEEQLSLVVMEVKKDKNQEHLYVHLPDRTLVYDGISSKSVGEAIWFTLTSALSGFGAYRAINFVWAYDRWLVADPISSSYGYFTDTVSSHYGKEVRWEFGTIILYSASRKAIFHELELVAITGRLGDSTIWTQYSVDGEAWSIPKKSMSGSRRTKRIIWFRQGFMDNFRMQRFFGTSGAFASFARLEARLEALNG